VKIVSRLRTTSISFGLCALIRDFLQQFNAVLYKMVNCHKTMTRKGKGFESTHILYIAKISFQPMDSISFSGCWHLEWTLYLNSVLSISYRSSSSVEEHQNKTWNWTRPHQRFPKILFTIFLFHSSYRPHKPIFSEDTATGKLFSLT
jgi:hypothetical protein